MEKFIGDAVMAVFGAPVAHEDDAERAVRAGLRILEAIDELNDGGPDARAAGAGRDQHGRGGGRAGRPPRAGRGDRHRRCRQHGVAAAGGGAGRRRSRSRSRRTGDRARLRVRGARAGHGEGQGGAARASTGRSRPRAGFGSDVTRTHTTPLVGRELEKPLLIGTFERAAQQRSCQLVTIVGEPGVGKSRLCAELLRLHRGSAGARPLAPGPLPSLRGGDRVLGARGDRQGRVRHPRVGHARRGGGEARAGPRRRTSPRPRLAQGPAGAARGAPAASRSSQEESFTAWRRFLEALAAERHDGARLRGSALGGRGAALLPRAPGRLGARACRSCSSARPGRSSTSGIRASAPARGTRSGSISPRSPTRRRRACIAALLERAVLPAETQQALLERAGGNPLYAEEFVRLLADRGRAG